MWLFKRKSKDDSIPKEPYKVKKYNITKHCVDDMQKRDITKGEVHINLTTEPIKTTDIKYDKAGRPSYKRSSKNKITTSINPENNNVASVHRLHTKEYLKIMEEKNGTNKKK